MSKLEVARNLRWAYLKSWEQAKAFTGDFQDALLHFLSINLDLPIINPKPSDEPSFAEQMGGVVTDEAVSVEAVSRQQESE